MNALLKLVGDRYRAIVVCSLAFTVALGVGMVKTEFNPDFRAYFSADNPNMQNFDQLEAEFNKRDTIEFLVVAKNGDIFSVENLELVRELTDLAWQIPHSRRVDSIANFVRSSASDDDISSDPLLPLDLEITERTVASVRRYALSDEVAKKFVSPAGKATSISVSLNLPDENKNASRETVANARELIAGLSFDRDELDIRIIGTAVVYHAVEEAMEKDFSVLVPASYVLMFLIMLIVLREWSGTALTVLIMFLTTISAFGFFSWIGLTFTPPVGAAPSMITIIAVADCMHFLVSYYHELSVGKPKASAIRNAFRTNIRPMFLTTLATVIGLLCLNFSEAPPYRDLGNIVAFGAIVAFVLSAIFLPAVLHCLPAPKRKRVATTGVTLFTKLEGLSHWVIKYYKMLISVILILTLIGVSQVFRNDLGDSWIDNYDDSFEIRKTLDIQNQWMYGAQYIDYRVGGKHPQSLNNPEFMGDVERITDWLRNNPDVRYVSSFSDNVKTINKALHADKQEYYSIPEDPNLLAQTNLLYELTLPFGMGPDEQVNFDQSATRLIISLKDMSSRELLDFDETFTGWADANLRYANVSSGTGLQMVFAHIMQSNIVQLTKGTILAFALISLSLIWLLKSVKLGLISIVPNIFPLILAYGAWGILDGRVDLSVSVVGTMSLGLVVDDTIHFLSKYQWARTQKGEDVYQAIRYAFRTAGVAMVITTLILALGFALLLFSHFRPTWALGGMLSMTVVFALLVDLLLLPGLLIVFDKKSVQDNKAVRSQGQQAGADHRCCNVRS